MDRILLKPAEAAEVLRIGRSQIYRLIEAGDVPTVRIGNTRLIPVKALHDWIARNAHPKPEDEHKS